MADTHTVVPVEDTAKPGAVAVAVTAQSRKTAEIESITAAAAKPTTDTNYTDINWYDEIEIEDMDYDEDEEKYTYPCPCGDRFEITRIELENGEIIAKCPSCSLLLKIVYDPDELMPDDGEDFELDTAIVVC
ncbi:Diphthamide biosynthesis protein 3 [Coemansia sp. RSA 921]|nr:Diphthamide biosynthesis protein 3 [Coemansia sp. RSA 921]KAJ2277360.1 Diphthamide biosynthesis protein 3 [Coemansia sp. RSA 451]KAJ2440409.1 Diphthamide biosynthesis protein 3 [Coemansia sp. RSA 2440]